ncbi:MAG: hypothetical protein WCZ10_14715, partial [Desulfobulbaceae bacterium]
MLRDKQQLLLNFNKALDLVLVAAAFLVAYFIKKYLLPGELKGLAAEPNYLLILVLAVALQYLTFRAFSLYDSLGSQRFHDLANKILKSVAVGILLLLFCLYLVHYNEVS